MKKAARLLLIIMALITVFALSSCRKTFDQAAYVKALLDAAYKAEFAEYLVLTESSQEAAQRQYEENIDYFTEEVCASLDVNVSESQRERIRSTIKKVLSAAAYEVGTAEKVSVNEYSVGIKVTPVTNFKEMEKPVYEFAGGFIEGLKSADMKKKTQEEIGNLYIDGIISVIEAGAQTIHYGEEKAINAPVIYTPEKKRWRIPPQEQGKIFDTLIELK